MILSDQIVQTAREVSTASVSPVMRLMRMENVKVCFKK